MEKWIFTNIDSLIWISISTVSVYLTVIILTKVFGKRSFSKMSSFDFACTIAIGSIIASTLLSSSVSLIEGAFGLILVYLLQSLTALFRLTKIGRSMIDNDPQLLMDGSEILYENLKKAKVTESDLRAKLREANVINLENVKYVVFETTGDISVLHSEKPDQKFDSWLISGVEH